jgi:hypothetical protein
MTQNTVMPREDPQPSTNGPTITPAIERRGVQNEGGFFTPYYLFELLGRQHGDELDPQGREPARRFLKRAFQQAMRGWGEITNGKPILAQTQQLWYNTLFQMLGFPPLQRLETPVETLRQGLVPISHTHFLNAGDETPLLFIDLHPFGTDLDQASYIEQGSRRSRRHIETDITTQHPSRAIEFVLDHNQTRWALLSNGTELRLYRKGGSIARQYLKINFTALFDTDDDKEWLVFWGLLRLDAFIPKLPPSADNREAAQPRCLLDRVIEESQRHATRVASDLRENMVRAVESLLQGVIDSPENRRYWKGEWNGRRLPDNEQLKTLFKETIYFLYRLLFILYAESRDLLPIGESEIYRETYSLEHLREIAERREIKPEDYDKTYYIQTLRTLFTLLRNGYPLRNPTAEDATTQIKKQPIAPFTISSYNGQLFDPERTELLDLCHIPDLAMREVILELSLSHPKKRNERRERYSYADLGVDQLGSIYEGLLVYEPSITQQRMVEAKIKGETRLVPQDQADELELPYDLDTLKPAGSFLLRIWGGRRKGSGSYYTPQEITAFLVKDALTPLVEPIIEDCGQRNEQGKPLRSAEEILKLKICDPAMGSGAFLVQACRYLGEAYGRALIAEGHSANERIAPDDLAHYKRRVAEKCIYGVDLNPLAVELAKVSLWLETLARDRPLTFLDAHLRCGNALIGAPLRDQSGKLDSRRLLLLPNETYGKATKEDTQAFKELLKELTNRNKKQLKKQVKELQAGQLSLFLGDSELRAMIVDYEQRRRQLEESDEDKSMEEAVALVHQKQELLQTIFTDEDSQIRRFKQVCDLWCAAWFWPADASVDVENRDGTITTKPLSAPTTIQYYDLASVIVQRPGHAAPEHAEQYLNIARKLAEEEMRFFHWELEFPEVWYDDEGQPLPNGGFDVIVGNPPWDSILLNSKEFWSNYLPTFRALGKQTAIKTSKDLRADPEVDESWRIYARKIYQQNNTFKLGNFFIHQGTGHLNTYKLFIERMVSLTKSEGTFSLVVPSGIYTDEGCTSLRDLLFANQRIRFILSLENRKGIFPIDSRFKVVLLSGEKTRINANKVALSGADDSQTVECLFLVGKDVIGRDLAPSAEMLGALLPELNRSLLHIPFNMVKQLAPNTFSLMEFKSQREVDLVTKIYANHPLMGTKLEDCWNAFPKREFNMTDDSPLFQEKPDGWPLWEGKMIYQFTCDYARPRYWINKDTGLAEVVRRAEIEDYQPMENWQADEPKLGCTNFRLGYRDVASGTNEITLIATILPPFHFTGNTFIEFVQWSYLPKPDYIWIKYFDESNKLYLASLLNSFVINFIIRQKVSAHVSMFLIGQLPIPRLPATHPVSQALVPLAARLTCVDERFAPLWEALAQDHPRQMDEEWSPSYAACEPDERAQLRAEIDARVADLYALSEEDFAYILSTFPLLDRDQPALPEEPKSFITRDQALLALFTLRAKEPPDDVVTFFARAGVDIRTQTGTIRDLRERVCVAREELGAVAYVPSRREREESEAVDGELEEEEFDEDY